MRTASFTHWSIYERMDTLHTDSALKEISGNFIFLSNRYEIFKDLLRVLEHKMNQFISTNRVLK